MEIMDDDFREALDWMAVEKEKATSCEATTFDTNSIPQREEAPNASEEKKSSQAEALIALAGGIELFRTPDGEHYTRIQIGDHWEIRAIKSTAFKSWLTKNFFDTFNKPPSSQAVSDAIGVLEAKSEYEGETIPVYVRVAGSKGKIYIDLCNDSWQAVEITGEGWQVVDNPPVRFRRSKGMLKLPIPEQTTETLDKLIKQFLNFKTETDLKLIVGFLIGSCCPDIPYPVLTLQGEHGTAKSTTSKVVRNLIDPATAPLRSVPKDERDIAISASNSWIVAYDNLSGMSAHLSDTICKLSTGGAFVTRKLHTDDQEMIFSFRRPVIINGIDAIATRQDLLSRALLTTLPVISEDSRTDEATFWNNFDKAYPYIFGALLNALRGALKALPYVSLPGKPRMADFAKFVTAAEAQLGWKPGSFMEAYSRNAKEAINQGIDSNPFATAVIAFMENKESWEGTPRQFLSILLSSSNDYVDERTRRWDNSFPKENKLKNAFKRAASALRSEGIEYNELPRTSTSRSFQLLKKLSQPSQTSHPSSNERFDNDDSGDSKEKKTSREEPNQINGYDDYDSYDDTNHFYNEDDGDVTL